MKVIDLLNKIANGEEVPKKIKWQGVIFQYEENNYRAGGIYLIEWVNKNLSNLNDEIEIIEEDKPIEKIRQFCEYPCSDKYECWSIKEDILVNKINEIIDKVNKLKKESDK